MKRNLGWSRNTAESKLKEASFFLNLFRLAETSEEQVYFLSAFLSAGRSLTAALEKRYRHSYSTWKSGSTNDERELLNLMTQERNDEIHEAGASRGVTICLPTLGTGSESDPATSFMTLKYKGKALPALPLCEEYLSLLRIAIDYVLPAQK